jgi:hypothetical protein
VRIGKSRGIRAKEVYMAAVIVKTPVVASKYGVVNVNVPYLIMKSRKRSMNDEKESTKVQRL